MKKETCRSAALHLGSHYMKRMLLMDWGRGFQK